jgi:ubiquinone/menaquinone biosynthesis C-methylase UbiE
MENHVCPWYMGYLLASPLRRLFQHPEIILNPYVKKGMTVLEVGPGMGFFTLPLAKLVGESGKVICVELQQKMLDNLRKRADKSGLLWRIETRLCTQDSLQVEDLTGKIDFALAFAVVHEIPDQKKLFVEVFNSLKKGGMVLVSEPTGHVTKEEFDNTLSVANAAGLKQTDTLSIKQSHAVILKKD